MSVLALPSSDALLDRMVASVRYALQPIVTIRTGQVVGYEALMRGYQPLGFSDPLALIDAADRLGFLPALDQALRAKAVATFCRVPNCRDARLFYNLDLRVLRPGADDPAATLRLLASHGLGPVHLCLELSERHDDTAGALAAEAIRRYHGQSYRLALDDFGTGYSGLKLLYAHQPDVIKIDRFFISGIEGDHKKRLFVSTVVDLAHVLGIQVVAEGVETRDELETCRAIGCDMAQGYLIARPRLDVEAIPAAVREILSGFEERRRVPSDARFVRDEMERLPALPISLPMHDAFEAFRNNPQLTFFPVVDERGTALGIVRETDIKEYIYSTYGRDLMRNRSYGKALQQFVTRCPIVDINVGAERIVQLWSINQSAEGILVTEDGSYVGFLGAASLLRVVNEKNLASARDQNPLTRLPGNHTIAALVERALADGEVAWLLAYLDFDNFKPFNDKYGFRQGDRAILMFSELLHKHFADHAELIAHVGGDDFFLAAREADPVRFTDKVRRLLASFARDMESFYDQASRDAGYIEATDRKGRLRRFPLMTCSAALVVLEAGGPRPSPDGLSALIAETKRRAKRGDGLALASTAA